VTSDGIETRNGFRAAELAARNSYGRLLAYLAARCRDVAAAEDALSDAFCAALETWPRVGIPIRPEAWLLTAARHRLLDRARRHRARQNAEGMLVVAVESAYADAATQPVFPDERLRLLFVCAHPAIDAGARTALMLQMVLGLDAARIASAFVVAPAAMSQRLVRAKAKIRDARIRFDVPDAAEVPARVHSVLDAIYAAFGTGWDSIAGADSEPQGLAAEAVWLGRLVTELAPDNAEARGLLALMLYCEARRPGRRGTFGDYVPLDQQDTDRWSRLMIDEAERMLRLASQLNDMGRYQLEAAIQSVHAQRLFVGRTDWEEVALLYEGLVRLTPTIGALVGYAAALAEARSAAVGLAALDRLHPTSVDAYQPYWALRAHLLARLGNVASSSEAYERAIGLTQDHAVREFLLRQLGRVATA
jgi:predicted RNA polymerase sigma factor